jgi:2-oxoglutarate ferredoxin oxidoreductase subunit alpha
MNNWMAEPFAYPDEPIKRGKVLDAETLTGFIEKYGKWGRYMDVDGDGVGYRTLPGTDHPNAAYFARGTGHNEMAVYSERSEDWIKNMQRLHRKLETARHLLPRPVTQTTPGSKVGLITFGSNEPAVLEARDWLAHKHGIQSDYLRVRALPLLEDVHRFVLEHERVYVLENNFDGQLYQVLNMEIAESTVHLKSLPLGDGLPMTPEWVYEQVMAHETAAQ